MQSVKPSVTSKRRVDDFDNYANGNNAPLLLRGCRESTPSGLKMIKAAHRNAIRHANVDTTQSTDGGNKRVKLNENYHGTMFVDLLCPRLNTLFCKKSQTEKVKNSIRLEMMLCNLAQRIKTYTNWHNEEKSQHEDIPALILCGETPEGHHIDFAKFSRERESIRGYLDGLNKNIPQKGVSAEWEKVLRNVVGWNPMLFPELTGGDPYGPLLESDVEESGSSAATPVVGMSASTAVETVTDKSTGAIDQPQHCEEPSPYEKERVFLEKVQCIFDRAEAMLLLGREKEAEKLHAMLPSLEDDEFDVQRAAAEPPKPFASMLAILAATDPLALAGRKWSTSDGVFEIVKRRVERLAPESPLFFSPEDPLLFGCYSGALDYAEMVNYSLHKSPTGVSGFRKTLIASYFMNKGDLFTTVRSGSEMEVFRIALIEPAAWPELFE